MTGTSTDKLHDISRYTIRNANTHNDVIFDLIKPKDAGKIACPLNIVQHIFIDFLSDGNNYHFLHCCRIMYGLSFKCFVSNHSGISAFVIIILALRIWTRTVHYSTTKQLCILLQGQITVHLERKWIMSMFVPSYYQVSDNLSTTSDLSVIFVCKMIKVW